MITFCNLSSCFYSFKMLFYRISHFILSIYSIVQSKNALPHLIFLIREICRVCYCYLDKTRKYVDYNYQIILLSFMLYLTFLLYFQFISYTASLMNFETSMIFILNVKADAFSCCTANFKMETPLFWKKIIIVGNKHPS